MSLKSKVVLEMEDGTSLPVVFDGRDLRAWETRYKRSSLSEQTSIGMLTWLGWHAAERQHLLNGAFEKWEAFDAVCVSVEGAELDEDKDADPPQPPKKAATRKTASAG